MFAELLSDDRIGVAPQLGSFAAPLVRVDQATLARDADARSRGLASVARSFRPDALWLNGRDGPEWEAFERLATPSAGAASAGEPSAAFEARLTVYEQTIANLLAMPGVPPLIASVAGPGALSQSSGAAAGDGAADGWLDPALGWAREAAKRYATAGVAGICVIEGRGWLDAGGDEESWRSGIQGVRRLIASFGIPALLMVDRPAEVGLGGDFDCVIASDPAQLGAAPGRLGIAVDPARVDEIADLSLDRWGDVRMITTSAEVPAASGIEDGRRLVAALRALAARGEQAR